MQDTTSSAMTEVALGLSMAFFALLIVALLSMSVPKETAKVAVNKDIPAGISKNQSIDVKIEDNSTGNDKNNIQFAFYFHDKLYDQSLKLRTITSFTKEQALIIAVDPNLAFAEVFSLRQQINHPKLSITSSNKAWHARLQKIEQLE